MNPSKLQLRQFQAEDLAAASLKDGLILAWEQGLGKTIAAILWPRLRYSHRTLIVAPAGLHKQIQQEAVKHFHAWVQPIATIQDAINYGLNKPRPIKATAPHTKGLYFLCSWEAFTRNGASETPLLSRADEHLLKITDPLDPRIGIGSERGGITCLATPSLASWLGLMTHDGAGVDTVVLDEGTRLQADDSMLSIATRRCIPPNRLILSGTPIKNRLDSIFWLCWWVAGGSAKPTALWPYNGDSEGHARFANQHLLLDRSLTREDEFYEDKGYKRKMEKRSNRACNIEHVFKLITPLVLRRRKTQTGSAMQPCTYHPILVPPGKNQLEAYNQLLTYSRFVTKTGRPIVDQRVITGIRLGMLREACLAPWSENLPVRSPHVFTPKIQSILTLIELCLNRGEQVLIGSPFLAFTSKLYSILTAAGVNCARCDGTETPVHRGMMAAAFKRHQYSVMIGGLKAMGEGHDFAQCSNVILPALSWSMDENEQLLHRAWRLSSKAPVRFYLVSVSNTLDARLQQTHGEKRDTAGLALDGELTPDTVDPITLEQLLYDSLALASMPTATENEQAIAQTLRPLLERGLSFAQARYNEFHPPTAPYRTLPGELHSTAADAKSAVDALDLPSTAIDPMTFLLRGSKAPTKKGDKGSKPPSP